MFRSDRATEVRDCLEVGGQSPQQPHQLWSARTVTAIKTPTVPSFFAGGWRLENPKLTRRANSVHGLAPWVQGRHCGPLTGGRRDGQPIWNGGQNPGGGVFDPKRAGLNLRGILSDDSYFSVELTEEHVLKGDLAHMAQEFYTAYCAAWDLR